MRPHRITRRGRILQRSYRSQLDFWPETVSHAERKQRLYTSVDADRPRKFASPITRGRKGLVEPPGIAPGSSPLIARAFISIVRTSPYAANIGASDCRLKNGRAL